MSLMGRMQRRASVSTVHAARPVNGSIVASGFFSFLGLRMSRVNLKKTPKFCTLPFWTRRILYFTVFDEDARPSSKTVKYNLFSVFLFGRLVLLDLWAGYTEGRKIAFGP